MEQTPKQVFKEYDDSCSYKSSLGDKGLYEQTKKNERFYSGDQWYGANVGNDRPLVRHNLIKRIADYKISVIDSSPITVNFTAEGVPNTVDMQNSYDDMKDEIAQGIMPQQESTNDEINFVMNALTDYYKTESERLGFDEIIHDALHNAYVSGTGVLYTYWDESVETGLYADESRTTAIKGDICTQVIDIENVEYGDPTEQNIQNQPYIILSMRKSCEELKREAKLNGISKEEIDSIKPDGNTSYMSGDRAKLEPTNSNKTTCLIKLYKEYNDDGSFNIMCLKCTENAFIKKPFDIGIKLYPIAEFKWHKRRNCAYGDSEVTHLIPNQIAINRMLTANVWAVMMMGMPIMMVNDDVINQPVTNNPGQIISFSGSRDDFNNAIQYIVPPTFSSNYLGNANDLISSTLTQSGANDAALGDIKADNTSAILAVREASTMPLTPFKNRFYKFVEDNARIWAQFWVNKYGNRQLKIEDTRGVYYIPFIAEKFKDLIISVRIDVGASTLWSEITAIQQLDGLLQNQIITPTQYLERLPKGVIPNLSGLIKDLRAVEENPSFTADDLLAGLSPEEQQAFNELSPEQQEQILGGISNDANAGIQ